MVSNQWEYVDLEWRPEGTPVSMRFDDPYYSIENGLAETQHVFLQGNDLPERFRLGFHIAELGFGTGLNMLAAWKLWNESGQSGNLSYTSFEAFPMRAPDLRLALSAFPALGIYVDQFLEKWEGGAIIFELDGLSANIIIGDANQTLPQWSGSADAWFLDGFSPAKNPELWESSLLESVAKHTAKGGSFATYTAAGYIRRSLSEVGFKVDRKPGYGRKRHMAVGTLSSNK